MRDSILTIPISEVFEPKCGCPICLMRDMLEQRSVEYIMGSAMMEPDVRIETNKSGFCKTHLDQMLGQKNRLSLALILQSHLTELNKTIFEHKRLFEGKAAKQKKVSAVNEDCFVCQKVEWGMERLLNTFFDMYQNSKEFRDLFDRQEYLCLPHYEMLVRLSAEKLEKKNQKGFISACGSLTGNYLKSLEEDVEHYTKMYDYRNTGKDADWKNSKDSIERTVKFLTSR